MNLVWPNYPIKTELFRQMLHAVYSCLPALRSERNQLNTTCKPPVRHCHSVRTSRMVSVSATVAMGRRNRYIRP